MAADAFEPDAIGAQLDDARFAQIGDHIGREVGRGVVHFVEDLLDHGVRVDPPAGTRRLGDRAVAVGVDLGDRIADMGEVGDVLVARVGVVAARDLRAAFEQVAGHGRAREPVPVVAAPAEVGERGTDGKRRVGDAAGDDDVGAGEQRVGDRIGAEVGVRADHRLHDGVDVGAGAERSAKQRSLRSRTEVVAFDDGDPRRLHAELGGEGSDAPRRAARVGGAEVADDADAVIEAARQHRPQQVIEERLVASVGIAPARQLGQRERALGERLEDQERRPAGGDERVDHRARGVGAVAGEAGGAADAKGDGGGRHGATLGKADRSVKSKVGII
jgi:hypothetical protein